MPVVPKERQLKENPSGKGWVFKGHELIAEVAYELQVFENAQIDTPIVSGKIKRTDKGQTLWGVEMMTLLLQDKRKLDFVCVNFDPECNIVSDKRFYR